MSITKDLAGKMAAAKQGETELLKDMRRIAKIAEERHDEAAAKVAELDEQIAKDPGNEELQRKRDEYDRVRSGLYAAVEYANGIYEQATGAAPVEPERHDSRDITGKFTLKDSLNHLFRKFLGKK